MKTRTRLAIAILSLGVSLPAFAGEVADEFRKAHPHPGSEPATQPVIDGKEVTEFGIECTANGWGAGPVFSAVFLKDGTVRYDGIRVPKMSGKHTGKIDPKQFDEVAKLILDSGYGKLNDNYRTPITDQSTVYSTAVIDGYRKVIRDYAHGGPDSLQQVEARIDALLASAKWDEPATPAAGN